MARKPGLYVPSEHRINTWQKIVEIFLQDNKECIFCGAKQFLKPVHRRASWRHEYKMKFFICLCDKCEEWLVDPSIIHKKTLANS